METLVLSPPNYESGLESQIESEDNCLVPENSNCDQPISKEPNDVYKNHLCQGFTLVFDSKTMIKPKSPVTTPTTPTTPTRRHQRTFSVATNQIWTDSTDSSVVPQASSKTENPQNFENEATEKEKSIEYLGSIKNTKISSEEQEQISKTVVQNNLHTRTNGSIRNGNYSKKSSESIILHDAAPASPLWKTVAIFLYFHFTAAIGIFLVLSSQVMWQTIIFTLGLHLLSAFGVSANFLKPFIPQIFNLNVIYDTLTTFIIPTVIPWILWEENIIDAFLVVAQVGYCLHWYGSWFSSRDEKVKSH